MKKIIFILLFNGFYILNSLNIAVKMDDTVIYKKDTLFFDSLFDRVVSYLTFDGRGNCIIGDKDSPNIDYYAVFRSVKYLIADEPNFYDQNIIETRILIECEIEIYDKKNSLYSSNKFTIDKTVRESPDIYKENLISEFDIKFKNYFLNLDIFIRDIEFTEINPLFVSINAGYIDDIKVNNFLESQRGSICVIKSNMNSSTGIYILKKDYKNDNETTFAAKKIQKFGAVLSVAGGVLFANLSENKPSYYPELSARLNIPVGLPFFNILLNGDFMFMSIDSKFYAPINVGAGIGGHFNIFNFYINIGCLAGVLLTQESSGSYRADSFSVSPFAAAGAYILKDARLFIETGYRYLYDDKFSKLTGVDLKGIYLKGGIGLVF